MIIIDTFFFFFFSNFRKFYTRITQYVDFTWTRRKVKKNESIIPSPRDVAAHILQRNFIQSEVDSSKFSLSRSILIHFVIFMEKCHSWHNVKWLSHTKNVNQILLWFLPPKITFSLLSIWTFSFFQRAKYFTVDLILFRCCNRRFMKNH